MKAKKISLPAYFKVDHKYQRYYNLITMDKDKSNRPTPSTVFQQVISDTVIQELKKSGVPENLVLRMLVEHAAVSDFLKEIFEEKTKKN